jgi:hypothetical protein
MLLIAVAGGATRAGLGVGGAVCLVGVGFLLTGWLHGSRLGRAAARPPVDRSDTRPPLEG